MTEDLYPAHTTEGDEPVTVDESPRPPIILREWSTEDQAIRLMQLATGESQLCIATDDGPLCFRPEDELEPGVLADRLRLTLVPSPEETEAPVREEVQAGEVEVREHVPELEESGATSPDLGG